RLQEPVVEGLGDDVVVTGIGRGPAAQEVGERGGRGVATDGVVRQPQLLAGEVGQRPGRLQDLVRRGGDHDAPTVRWAVDSTKSLAMSRSFRLARWEARRRMSNASAGSQDSRSMRMPLAMPMRSRDSSASRSWVFNCSASAKAPAFERTTDACWA